MSAVLTTERLRLRPFTRHDLPAILTLFSDPAVNTFLPWWPLATSAEARAFYEARLQDQPYCWALELDAALIGYIKVEATAPYELGYALSRAYWHQGLTSDEAGAEVLRYVAPILPYVIATHDRNNPHSGAVMRKLGLKYCYSYREQWQPKDIPVVFRLYQRNFTAPPDFVYRAYWERSAAHMIEAL